MKINRFFIGLKSISIVKRNDGIIHPFRVILQKEISDLQAQFDQKRLTHVLEMKKIDPNFTEGRGFGMGMGMGPGKGPGPFGAGRNN